MFSKTVIGSLALSMALAGVSAQAAEDEPDAYYVFTALDGEQVTGGGSEDGFADFNARLDPNKGEICYTLIAGDIDDATGGSINRAKPGADGEADIALELADEENCIPMDTALVKKIGYKASNYYIVINSEEYPNGAVRGQLED